MNTKQPSQSNDMRRHAAKAEALLKSLANAKRLMILCSLVEGEKPVMELSKIAGLSQSAVSQHLAKMRDSGIVDMQKRGQMAYYRIASMEVRAVLSTLHLIYCK